MLADKDLNWINAKLEAWKMVNPSKNAGKKILFMLTSLLLLFGTIDTRGADHHPISIVTLAEIDVLYQRKKHIRREIEKGRQDVAAFTRRESDIIKHLNQVELALNTSKKRAADLKREIEKLSINGVGRIEKANSCQ
jgi:hypothetical protein